MSPLRYHYLAIDAVGQRQQGVRFAANEQALVKLLQVQGLLLIHAHPKRQRRWQTRVPLAQLAFFCFQMQVLLQAGVPLLQALSELGQHCESAVLAEAIQQLHFQVESGTWLSQAVLAQAKVFPAFMAHLLAAGEHTGELAAMFGHLADTLQWQQAMRTQLWHGLSYPMLLCLVVVSTAVVMLTYLVPQLSSFISSMGHQLPWSTRALLSLSSLLRHHGWTMLGILAASLAIFRFLLQQSETLAQTSQRCLLQLPVIGDLLRLSILTRFSRFLGLMYRAGIPILQALRLCIPIVYNRYYSLCLQQVIANTESGHGLAVSFKQATAFPPLFVHMVEVGERSGALDVALAQISRYFEQRLQYKLAWLLRMLEPALTVVMGLMLLFLMAAVIMPIYDSFSQLGGLS